jgi:methylated-DNA-[protein]-cysteine S-methyltransferase
MLQQMVNACAFRSRFGWNAIAGNDNLVRWIVIGRPSEHAAFADLEMAMFKPIQISDWNPNLVERLQALAEGAPDDLRDVMIGADRFTPFQQRVVEACRDISWGETQSYGELAAIAGSPGAARAVGNIMAANRFPLVVPCHRVVGAAGRLGGFSAPDGVDLKRRLLDLESASSALAGVRSVGQRKGALARQKRMAE